MSNGSNGNKYLRFARYVEALLAGFLITGFVRRFSTSQQGVSHLDFSSWNDAATLYHALGILVFLELYIVQCVYHEDLRLGNTLRPVAYKPYHLFFDLSIAFPFCLMGVLERAPVRDVALLLLVGVTILFIRQAINVQQIAGEWKSVAQRVEITAALVLNILGIVLLGLAVMTCRVFFGPAEA